MIGQGLAKVVAEVPAQRKAVGYNPHKLTFRAQVLEEHHQLELEEHDRIHRRTTFAGIERTYQLPDEREVQRAL